MGLIGCGYDEDGKAGYINPLMIDQAYQGNSYAAKAMEHAIDYLKKELRVSVIHLGHRRIILLLPNSTISMVL